MLVLTLNRVGYPVVCELKNITMGEVVGDNCYLLVNGVPFASQQMNIDEAQRIIQSSYSELKESPTIINIVKHVKDVCGDVKAAEGIKI